MINFRTIKRLAILTGVLGTTAVFAQQATSQTTEESSILSNGVFLAMLSMIILLLFIIIGMAEVVKAGAAYQLRKKKEAGDKSKIAATLLFIFMAGALYAQQASSPAAPAADAQVFNYWRMGAPTFFLMLSIILFEVLVIFMLFRSSLKLLDREELRAKKRAEQKIGATEAFLEKMNASVAIEEEAAILMDHDYDGIRELDNNLPPWWKYGFYVTIVFALIYLFHFHVFNTGKSSAEEYAQEVKDGDAKVAEYRKTAADMVDENTVTLLTDAASISSGKTLYLANCKPCHGELGQGMPGSGPNFTDDYWLHGGSIKDVFKSIKYGWTSKGMREWGSEIKPKNIQEIASYIKSLRGTNPPDAQPKQGELYVEEGAKPQADSAGATDSLPPKPAADSLKK